MRLHYTPTALRRIEDALAYTEPRSPQGAAGLRERILATTTLIQDHPHAGQATSRAGIRRVVLVPYPYVIYYRITEAEIVISRFRHAARRPLAR